MFSGFMMSAWIVASIVAVVAGVVGFFVVMRGSAFAAHALPQSAFTGAAAGLAHRDQHRIRNGGFRPNQCPRDRLAGESGAARRGHCADSGHAARPR